MEVGSRRRRAQPAPPHIVAAFLMTPTAIRTLLVDTEPDASRLGYYRHRLNLLINGNLRLSYGQ